MFLSPPPLAHSGRTALRHTLALFGLCLGLAAFAQDPQPLPTVKRSPAVRLTPLEEPTLSDSARKLLRALVGQSMALSDDLIQTSARIIAGPQGRVFFGAGDRVYAAGTDFAGQSPPQRGQRLRIFRETGPLKDPDTGTVLGQETQFLGHAVWVSRLDVQADSEGLQHSDMRVPASLDIESSAREIRVGDRVLMAQLEPPEALQPHWPSQAVAAKVLRLYGLEQQQASQNQIIVINKGRNDGLEVGHLLSIVSRPITVRDADDPLQETWLLPRERSGTVLVFSAFERFAYALITESKEGVRAGDVLTGP